METIAESGILIMLFWTAFGGLLCNLFFKLRTESKLEDRYSSEIKIQKRKIKELVEFNEELVCKINKKNELLSDKADTINILNAELTNVRKKDFMLLDKLANDKKEIQTEVYNYSKKLTHSEYLRVKLGEEKEDIQKENAILTNRVEELTSLVRDKNLTISGIRKNIELWKNKTMNDINKTNSDWAFKYAELEKKCVEDSEIARQRYEDLNNINN